MAPETKIKPDSTINTAVRRGNRNKKRDKKRSKIIQKKKIHKCPPE